MNYANEIRDFVIANFLFGDAGSLTDDTSFLESGIIDSTGILELILFLEQRYEIKVLDQETVPDNLDSVNRIAQFLSKKLAKPLAA